MNEQFLGDKYIDIYIKYIEDNGDNTKFIEIEKLDDFFDTLKGSKAIKMYLEMETIGGGGREAYFSVDGDYITTYRLGFFIDEMNNDKRFRQYLKRRNKHGEKA